MAKCGQDLTSQFMGLNPQLQRDLATTMGNLEVPLVVREDTHLVGTLVGDTITQVVEVKVEEVLMAMGHILKVRVHLMGLVVCRVLVIVVEVVVDMEVQIIPRVVHTVGLQVVVAQT